MLEAKFNQLYKALNPAQKEAVDTIEGPVMVVAGPGTGKTQVLTLRLANILRLTDTAPENILALTFTESAAAAMRRRLAEIIGSRAYALVINTFHGFCNDIIKKYPEYFPRIIGSRHLTAIDQIHSVELVMAGVKLSLLKPFGDPVLYVPSVVKAIEELKRQGVSVKRFAIIVKDAAAELKLRPDLRHPAGAHRGKVKAVYQKQFKQIEKNRELAKIYEAYEKYLVKQQLYDFSDMIMEVLKVLEAGSELLQLIQEEHQYILVDEHQDTNNAQNRILERLGSFHSQPNLFVVGDEKQAIFRFQGASLENFLYFKKQYPTAKLITLSDNYRSTQTILDSAHSLLPGFTNTRLRARASFPREPIRIYGFSQSAMEPWFVARDIKKLLSRGVPAESIAILYRDNKDAGPVARALEQFGVPAVIESDQDLLVHPDIKKLLLMMQAVADFGNDDALMAALHVDYFRIDPLDIYEVVAASRAKQVSLHQLLRAERKLQGLTLHTRTALRVAYHLLSQLTNLSHNLDLVTWVEKLIHGSGVLKATLLESDPTERLSVINRFYDEIVAMTDSHPEATLKDFLAYLKTVSSHRLLIKRGSTVVAPGQVRLMTIHRAKGLEFAYVYIINVHDGHFGNRTERQYLTLLPSVFLLGSGGAAVLEAERNDDERRLFYVAITRAARAVKITYARATEAGREQLPSLFIAELKPELRRDEATAAAEKLFRRQSRLATGDLSTQPRVGKNQSEFVERLFTARGFSVTGLNNYLACPWRYFYRNLLRLPEALSKHQRYGVAVHAALRDFFKRRNEEPVTVTNLLQNFEYYLQRQGLKPTDYQEVRRRGRLSLSGWYRASVSSWPAVTLTEFNIKGILLTPQIRLTGVIDKLEFVDGDNQVKVVDYKTRSPLGRRELEGKTRGSSGDYLRQLVFYKLLLDRYESGRYRMTTGELDFIEPDPRGRYRRELFVISAADVSVLEQLIKRVGAEILALDFWDKRCGDHHCRYCELRGVI